MKPYCSKHLLILLVTLVLFNSCRHEGQNEGTVLPVENEKMTVAKLLERQNMALDRKGIFRKAESYMMKQKLEIENSDDFNGSVVQYFKSPGKTRILSYLNGKLFVTKIFDGRKGWTINANDRSVTEITGKELELQKILTAMSNPTKDLTRIFKKIDLDEVSIEDNDYYRLTCYPYPADLEPFLLFIDKEDFLTKRLEIFMWSGGKKVQYVSGNKKYVDIDGVKVVEVMIVQVLGSTQTYTLQEFKLNVPVPDSDFELIGPYEVKENPESGKNR